VLQRLRPTTPLGRAVLPVAGGLAFFGLLALATWGIAAVLSQNPDSVNERLAQTTFEVGNTARIAALIADDGPLLFQGLIGDAADRSVVLDHTGDIVDRGWVVYYAHPADRADTCKVTQVQHTRRFNDCDGREIDVEDLAPPPFGVRPIVGTTVIIDLRSANSTATTVAASTDGTASTGG
jgi:hypothetical protein